MSQSYMNEALDKYMTYFSTNLAYGLLEQQQLARAAVNVKEIEEVKKKEIIKNRTYEQIGQSIYLRIPLQFLIAGERIIQRNMKNIRYQLLTLTEIVKHFGNSIDIFVDGLKVPFKDIRIALYEDYFVAEIPKRYENYKTINAFMRGYVLDITSTTNTITLDKRTLNSVDKNSFIIYGDGSQINDYSVTESGNNIIIKTSKSASLYEVTYLRYLNKLENISLVNNHIDITDNKRKFPIAAGNIITYLNGKFINLELEAKTDGIFKAVNPISGSFTLYYFYKEYDFEDANYDDDYAWFARYNSDTFMNIVNNPSLLPDFINHHELYREDISLQDFVKNKYNDINVYNKDKTLSTINYNEECFITFLDYVYNAFYNNDNLGTISEIFDMSTLGKDNWIRKTNRNDMINPQNYIDFKIEMVLFKIPNREKNTLCIYVDGIKIYDNYVMFWESDTNYLYINSSMIEEDSIIEIEKIKCNHSSLKETLIIGDGTKTIKLTDVTTSGFYTNEKDLDFFVLAESYNSSDTKFVPSNISFNSVVYDKENDTITFTLNMITSINTVYKLYNTNYTQTFQTDTRTESSGYDITLTGMGVSVTDVNNFRCFKNGKELPRKYWTLTFPSKTNNLTDPQVHFDVKYGIYEHLDITYSPTKYVEATFIDELDRNGLVDLLNTTGHEKEYISNHGYYTLNGERFYSKNFTNWCSKGISLHDLDNTKYFTIVYKDNGKLLSSLTDYLNAYVKNPKELDQYILQLMHSKLDDSINIGLDEPNPPITEIDTTRQKKLYYDLYNEFLKLNIINSEAKMPEYIILKYGALVDEKTDIIKIDANTTQYKWMPLDANTQDANMENIVKILDLYYQLLDNWEYIYSISRDEIPDEVYETYKDLFDNNVLVLQMPDVTNLI